MSRDFSELTDVDCVGISRTCRQTGNLAGCTIDIHVTDGYGSERYILSRTDFQTAGTDSKLHIVARNEVLCTAKLDVLRAFAIERIVPALINLVLQVGEVCRIRRDIARIGIDLIIIFI